MLKFFILEDKFLKTAEHEHLFVELNEVWLCVLKRLEDIGSYSCWQQSNEHHICNKLKAS